MDNLIKYAAIDKSASKDGQLIILLPLILLHHIIMYSGLKIKCTYRTFYQKKNVSTQRVKKI